MAAKEKNKNRLLPFLYTHQSKETYFYQGKKLPMTFEEDLDEGDVTEEDSADEMEDCFKFKNSEVRESIQILLFQRS